ncbi:MAG: response regulator, partial [Planctomycetes bacterium]|nr:response regulator [Planctomycetota bacterium]
MAAKKKVLVVDDERDVITYLSALLGDAGYEVVTAMNGKEAVAQARRERPDLVSLDLTMPEESGVGCYRELRQDPALGKIPIVILTGIVNPWAAPDGTGGMKAFLSTRRKVPPPD